MTFLLPLLFWAPLAVLLLAVTGYVALAVARDLAAAWTELRSTLRARRAPRPRLELVELDCSPSRRLQAQPRRRGGVL